MEEEEEVGLGEEIEGEFTLHAEERSSTLNKRGGACPTLSYVRSDKNREVGSPSSFGWELRERRRGLGLSPSPGAGSGQRKREREKREVGFGIHGLGGARSLWLLRASCKN
ncbi:hypothetical protein MA16_Dca003749 [Dendrobium catenatum]|uniref:Uncharacterized protein n=1 Tax=Dendrobium catenatum TaxID=906689 RepID=A0A2I0WFV5_9ASPA|nr:hypothetical protein MA16_Dca003749 [Dendrobium catenatum]